MKRLWITLAVLALAAIVALPATAKQPPEPPVTTTTTTTPGFVECSFHPDTGVLDSWHGQADDERQCIWNVDNPAATFQFQIQSPDGSVTKVKLPVLIVNDDIVFPSDKCFHDSSGRGFQDLPYPADSSWEITPTSAGCGDGPYLLTISIQALKSGTVNLVMTQEPFAN